MYGRLATLWLLSLLVLAPLAGALAAPPSKTGPAGEFPLHISAARLEADQKEGLITFSGQVKAEYGDSTLYADQLRVYFKKGTGAAAAKEKAPPEGAGPGPLGDLGGEKIDRIVAKGQVRFVQEDRVATGQEAIYYRDRDEVVLLGNPQVWRAENTLKGERIVFNIRTNRVRVESSAQKRVEAHLYPQGASGAKESPPPGAGPRKGRRP